MTKPRIIHRKGYEPERKSSAPVVTILALAALITAFLAGVDNGEGKPPRQVVIKPLGEVKNEQTKPVILKPIVLAKNGKQPNFIFKKPKESELSDADFKRIVKAAVAPKKYKTYAERDKSLRNGYKQLFIGN